MMSVTSGLCLMTSPAMADEWARTLGLTGAFSDNVARAASDERSDVAYLGDIGLQYSHEVARLSADLNANYRYQGYADHTFASKGFPSAAVVTELRVVPERFSWQLEDEYGQIAPTPFGALNPEQRQNQNYLTTGPTVSLPLGRKNELNLTGAYSETDYSVADIDNNQVSGTAQLLRSWGTGRDGSINYSHTQTRFDRNDLYREYAIEKAFVRLRSTVRRTSLVLDAGASSNDLGGDKTVVPLLSVTAYRQVGAYTRIGVDHHQGFSDSSEAFRYSQLGSTAAADQDVLAQAGPFREKQTSAFVSVTNPKVSAQLTVHYDTENYEADRNQDRDSRGALAEGHYQISVRTALSAFASFDRFDSNANPDQDDVLVGVGAQYRLGTFSWLNLQLLRYQRDTAAPTDDFVENRIALTWSYRRASTPRFQSYNPFRARGVPEPGEVARRRGRDPAPRQ